MPTPLRLELEPKVRQMRADGYTIERIASELPISEKTIRTWLKGEPAASSPQRHKAVLPNYRQWPDDWTAESLADLPGYELSAWEGNIALINTAQAQRRPRVPWFFRRLVELGRRQSDWPSGQEPTDWAVAVAAIPVIGDWLGCGSCGDNLAAAIEEYKPWDNGKVLRRKDSSRRRFQEFAQVDANQFRDCLFTAQATATQLAIGGEGSNMAPTLLAALIERIPLFGVKPRVSMYRNLSMGGIVLRLLSLPDSAILVDEIKRM